MEDPSKNWQSSFPRAKRFKKLKPTNDLFYDIPSMLNKKTCGFGYGSRWVPQNNKGRDSPPPTRYNLPMLSSHVSKTPIYKKPSLRVHHKQSPVIPGPGTYNPKSPSISKMISMSPRITTSKRPSRSPSPDAYNPSYKLVQNSSFNNITFGIGDRSLKNIRPMTPGPGTYDIPSAFKPRRLVESSERSKKIRLRYKK